MKCWRQDLTPRSLLPAPSSKSREGPVLMKTQFRKGVGSPLQAPPSRGGQHFRPLAHQPISDREWWGVAIECHTWAGHPSWTFPSWLHPSGFQGASSREYSLLQTHILTPLCCSPATWATWACACPAPTSWNCAKAGAAVQGGVPRVHHAAAGLVWLLAPSTAVASAPRVAGPCCARCR